VALKDALDDRNVDDHVATLQHLTVAAPDAHANTTTCPGEHKRAYPPFAVELIEGQIVVTATSDKAVARGDLIITVDGRPAAEHLAVTEQRFSGSAQWRVTRASADLGAGPVGSTLALRVRRAGAELDVTVTRGDRMPAQYSHPSIDCLDGGVYYVDLGRAPLTEIDAIMDRLAAAPGVVFDMRGYPNSNHAVLSHLLTRPDDSKAWMAVPHVLRPDHVATSMPTWDTYGWQMPVVEPHIGGRVAFLTGPRAASYAESVMGLVEHYRLGAIVGAPTTGTNGNIAWITTPSGCRVRFTGMRVTKHDGAQHHLVGIQPTIPASLTIAGVLAGRDEVLEKGLAYVRDSK
jgi:C-terminal processing protease CtpA/Prc